MTPWSDDLVLKPMCEVWIKYVRVPLHARCTSTFMAIGQHWGEVLMVEFGSLESGFLDDGRIHILLDVVNPFSFDFKLKVDGKEFDCGVVEDGSAIKQMKDCLDLSGSSDSGQSR
ncbi:hypothetical protein Dimus_017642 [Dionaea muscipula]